MHRCSSSQGNMAGPCTCGLFHSQSNSFSMLFSMPNHKPFDETDMYPFTSSSSSSSVDCTLSLGTPSTRLTDNDEKRMHHDRRAGSRMSNFCWDILQSKHTPSAQTHKPSRGGSSSNNCSGDPLLARRCANCDTTSTPLWRNGPRGPKVISRGDQCLSLCWLCLFILWFENLKVTSIALVNCSRCAMPVEFDSRRKRGEPQPPPPPLVQLGEYWNRST